MRSLCRLLLACVCIAGMFVAPAAQAQATFQFDIPAQMLADSLRAIGRQTGINVLFDPPLVDGLRARALKGTLTADQAFARLLDGTQLRHRFLDDRTVTIATVVAQATTRTATDVLPVAAGADQGSPGDQPARAPANPATDTSAPPTADSRGAAQRANEPPPEEIVVTAQKRAERVIDVPISMVTLTGDELTKRNITRMDDLSLAVPGMAIQSSGSFQRQITIRGVSNIFGGSSLIGVYLDEASVTSAAGNQLDLQTYDLERIEVLRGPQGTLYGEGSAGGTVRFITRNPKLDKFTLDADVAALFTQAGAPSQRMQTVVNVPVIEDTLGLRVAGTFDHEGGWMNQPAADVQHFNSQNLTDLRIKGLWLLLPQLSINVMTLIHRSQAAPNTGEDANGNFSQVFNFTTTPHGDDNYEIYNLTATYDFPTVRILNTSSYINQNKDFADLGFRYQLTPPGTAPFNQYIVARPHYDAIFNDELRLTSLSSGSWQWTVGTFYRRAGDEEITNEIFDLPGPTGAPPSSPFLSPTSTLSKSWAVFGDTNYKISDRLTLGTGLRYFRDDEEDRLNLQASRFHAVNPRGYAQYKLTDAANVYANAGKGFRSGGLNLAGAPVYGPETVWTYEIGSKTSLEGGRLSTDTAIFYSDYSNYQISHFEPSIANVIITNAGDARIFGAEWAVTWRPTHEWSVSFSGDYLNTKFTKITIDPSLSPYAVGDPLDLFPKYEYTVSAQRNFQWGGKACFARFDYGRHGRETYRQRNAGPWYFNQSDVINLMNFSANVQWNESLSLSLLAQNLLNDRGFLDPYSNEDNAARSRPRTFGMQISVRFD